MITTLGFQNFKSWHDTGKMRFAPITALFGTNSSGKSSILQMLLMLKQTAESSDRKQTLNLGDERSLVELGTFKDLLFCHDLEKALEWRMEWHLPKTLRIENSLNPGKMWFEAEDLGFSAKVSWHKDKKGLGGIAVNEMSYDIGESDFGMRRSMSKPEYEYELSYRDTGHFKLVRTPGRPWPLPPPAKCYGFPDQVRAYYQNAQFLSDFELQFEELFSRLYYLGPLREYPKRQYSWGGAQPADMGRRGEKVVDALLASREAGATISRGRGRGRRSQTLEERVAQWLKDLGMIHSFNVRPITKDSRLFQVWVRQYLDAPEVLITDVGFGVSQILPVITLCYYVPEGSILLLEQPEIHLHPLVQSGLADVFIDAAKTRGVQIILESHSEHLLRRLQRRVAEETLDPKDAALYFCSTRHEGSHLTPLEVDLFGTIDNWPKDFFGDDFGEIAATQKAALRRKRKGVA